MIKFINPIELIQTELFVEEPVVKLNEEISSNNSKKIILNGTRYSGKSVVLNHRELNKMYTDDLSVFTHFDSIGLNGILSNEKLYTHYYELLMSSYLLTFLKKNYNEVYEIHFSKYSKLIKKMFSEMDDYIKNYGYKKNVKVSKFLSHGEISSLIVEKMKKELQFNSLNLLIDRFDWTDARSEQSQITLSKYFELFDKSIIVVDDEINTEKKIRLESDGYSVFTTGYSKTPCFIKELVEKRVYYYNSSLLSGQNKFPIEKITDEIYDCLVSKANGNIKVILKMLNDTNMFLKWTNGNFEISNLFKIIDYEVEQDKELRKIFCPPKFHL